jgi:hypothetical protein
LLDMGKTIQEAKLQNCMITQRLLWIYSLVEKLLENFRVFLLIKISKNSN